ncbi:MAG TPA: dihydrodipicolinate synthase family protein [Chloroflexota bacterium]|nr:dihydrodipicolinate synthase family protein [Chloroflexota bacterium]
MTDFSAHDTLRSHLRGVISFPVTPFKANLDLDLDALKRNVAWLVERGIRTLVAAGGTGELYSLTVEEAGQVHRAVIDATGGKAAVICGVGGKLREAQQLAAAAEKIGAAGILMLPAAYGTAPDDGMLAYYAGIAKSVRIGVLPYARDWAVFTPDLMTRLAETPNVIAYKDGSADLRLWARIMAKLGDRLVWVGGVGDDMVHTYFAAGAEGFTSSVANFMPEVALDLFKLANGGKFAEARALFEEKVADFYALRAKRRGYEVSSVKYAMELCGLTAGPVRPPLTELAAEDRAVVERVVDKLGLRKK